MINALSIAKLGVGFGAAAVASIGFLGGAVIQPVQQPVSNHQPSTGGASYDAGTGYIWTDHGWVKLTKFVRVGTTARSPVVLTRSSVEPDRPYVKALSRDVETHSSCNPLIDRRVVGVHEFGGIFAHSRNDVLCGSSAVGSRALDVSASWLNADELAAILELMDI